MITARLAAQQGREVFALPSNARDLRAGGNLRLLREGAVLVRDATDVLTELGLERTVAKRRCAASPSEAAVLDAMVPEGTDFSTLIVRTGLDASELSVRITELELDGLLERDGDRIVPADLCDRTATIIARRKADVAMDRYAVVGQPVAHSLSPQIHAAFAAALGIELSYEAIEAPLDGFAATVADLFDRGYRGGERDSAFQGRSMRIR